MHSSRRGRRLFSLLLVALTVLAGSASAFAQATPASKFTATPLTPSDQASVSAIKNTNSVAQPQGLARMSPARGKMIGVIVKLSSAPLATYKGDVPGLAATSPQVTGAATIDTQSTTSKQYLSYLDAQQDTFVAAAQQAVPAAAVTQRLDVVINAVSMLAPADQIDALSHLPGVAAVYPDALLKLDTDRSPAFIGAPTAWNALGGQESAGEHVIVGVLDTGIWPEHPSFSDPDPSGKPYSAPPPPPGPTPTPRACQFSGGANPGPAFTCNNKLIGAYRFSVSGRLVASAMRRSPTSVSQPSNTPARPTPALA